MRIVALISQPMRASHCVSYLGQRPGSHSVLTSDPTAFDALDVPEGTLFTQVNPPPELLPSTPLARSRRLRNVLARARAGSVLGHWLERVARRLLRRMRSAVSPSATPTPGARSLTADDLRDSAMYQQLAKEHGESAFDLIVAFDLFDLPVGLRFGDDHQIPVVVR